MLSDMYVPSRFIFSYPRAVSVSAGVRYSHDSTSALQKQVNVCHMLAGWMTHPSLFCFWSLCYFISFSDFQISALREWMAQLGLRETVKVGNAGKWKTATQVLEAHHLPCSLFLRPFSIFLVDATALMISLSAAFRWWRLKP